VEATYNAYTKFNYKVTRDPIESAESNSSLRFAYPLAILSGGEESQFNPLVFPGKHLLNI
jgi:hypothetical protein